MNFKEICEAVLEETDGRGVQLASVDLGRDDGGDLILTQPTHRNIVRWVADEYMRIQRESANWEFHHQRGLFLTLTATEDTYTKPGIRRLNERSFYAVKDGTTAREPVAVQDYSWWIEQVRRGINSGGSPFYLIEAPQDQWIIWPTPAAVYRIYGDWWIEEEELLLASDVTLWDDIYDRLLVWGVVELYAAEFASEGSLPKLMARAQRMLPSMRAAFNRKYLSDTRGACALI